MEKNNFIMLIDRVNKKCEKKKKTKNKKELESIEDRLTKYMIGKRNGNREGQKKIYFRRFFLFSIIFRVFI